MPRLFAVLSAALLLAAAPPALAQSVPELQYLEDAHTHAILNAVPARDPDSPRNAREDECAPDRDLTGPGRLMATALGQRLQSAGIRINQLVASPRCDAALTARLLKLVPVHIEPFLAPPEEEDSAEDQRDEAIFFLAGLQPRRTALVVTHASNIEALTGLETVPGQMLIVRVSPLGELRVLHSILP